MRITVDLSPVAHRQFRAWLVAAAETLGVASVSGEDAVRALVALLVADGALSDRVRDEIAARRER